jgi:hypothetical protein
LLPELPYWRGTVGISPEFISITVRGLQEFPMATDEECVGYARECVRLAGLATDYELQEQLLQMARNWMAEAMHERCKDVLALKPPAPSSRLRPP